MEGERHGRGMLCVNRSLAILTICVYKPKKIHFPWGRTCGTVGSTSPTSLRVAVHHRIHHTRYELNIWAAEPDDISLHHLLQDLNISLPHATSKRLSHITHWHVIQTNYYFQTRDRWKFFPQIAQGFCWNPFRLSGDQIFFSLFHQASAFWLAKCARAVRKVSNRCEYLEQRSRGLDVTWQPVREDLTVICEHSLSRGPSQSAVRRRWIGLCPLWPSHSQISSLSKVILVLGKARSRSEKIWAAGGGGWQTRVMWCFAKKARTRAVEWAGAFS